jgi:hypothetical protein
MTSWKLVVAAVAAVFAIGAGVLAALLIWYPSDSGTGAPDPGDSRARSDSSAPEGTSTSEPDADRRSPIETTSRTYFGRPFETIRIEGRYVGVHTPRTLRVELRQAHGWRRFPLPAVTEPSGRFHAYLELGAGQYRVRLVDAVKDRASGAVTVMVF